MNKKSIVYLVIITILLIVMFAIFSRCTRAIFNDESIKKDKIETKINKEDVYSLEEQPIKYKVNTKKGREEYFEYIKQYIKPIKLLSFVTEKDLTSLEYNTNGNEMLKWLVKVGYINMIESMFDTSRANCEDCAVTKKFLEKFNTNLNDYFDIGGEENWIEVYTTDKIIKYTKRWNIMLDGEAEYAMLYRFKYMLDEDGNVDDVILEHIGWD